MLIKVIKFTIKFKYLISITHIFRSATSKTVSPKKMWCCLTFVCVYISKFKVIHVEGVKNCYSMYTFQATIRNYYCTTHEIRFCVHVNGCTIQTKNKIHRSLIQKSTHLLMLKINLFVIYLLVLQIIANSVPFNHIHHNNLESLMDVLHVLPLAE